MPLTIPMFGELTARVHSAAPVSIHGDVYFDLTLIETSINPSQATTGLRVRVPRHICPGGEAPNSGDAITLNFLMQQPVSLKRLA